MEPINTVVKGTPSSCRSAASLLGQIDRGVYDTGSAINRARSESESCWTGDAGDAFRQAMSQRGKYADDLAEAAGRAEKALKAFADELQTVIGMIKQARSVASEHGLTVTPFTIEPPGPAPQSPAIPDDPTALPVAPKHEYEAYTAAKGAYDRKVKGYEEAKATVDQARKKEAEAHKALTSAMDYESGLLESLQKGALWSLVGVNHGLITQPQMTADAFHTKAASFVDQAAKAGQAANDPSLTASQRAHYLSLQEKFTAKADKASTRAANTQVAADRLHRRIGVGPKTARVLGKSVGKRIPVVGTGISVGVQVEAVVNDGKPVGKAAANVGGGIVGGIAAGAAVGGMVGGPVGVIVGVGVGAVGSGIGSWLGEESYDAATEGEGG